MMKSGMCGVALAVLAACASGEQQLDLGDAASMPTAGGSCADIAKLALPDATVTIAELSGAGARLQQADTSALPAFCRVAATVKPTADSNIRIEVWMPAQGWNGKFLGTGNGGASGAIGYAALSDGVARGYAVAATDTGHQGGPADYSFAVGHPEKLRDNAWRAVHEMTVKGKAIVEAYYDAGPRLSYWNACSTGGRQGLKAAERFPADYDAIVAGAPARAWPQLPALSVIMQNTIQSGELPVAKLSVLKEGFIRHCDSQDGVGDRVVTEPAKCGFDPVVLQCAAGANTNCLTPGEVVAARKIYAGLKDPRDGSVLFAGMLPGSEPGWAGLAQGFTIGESFFRNVVHGGDKDWKPTQFDVTADMAKARDIDRGEMDASNADLSAFLARGGKLILYHGLTDGLIPAQSTVDAYAGLVARHGKSRTEASVRMFLMPGVDHCRGGEGAGNADFLGALETWVEKGKAPERIIASKQLTPDTRRMRPLCAYPKVGKYSGAGMADDAENWVCEAS